MEVFTGEGVDERTEPGGEADVGDRQPVGHQIDGGVVVPDREPRAKMHLLGGEAARRKHRQRHQTGEEGEGERTPHQPCGGLLPERPVEEGWQADKHERGRRGSELEDDQERHDRMGRGGRRVEQAKQAIQG